MSSGDPEVLPVKVIWDYTYYWAVLCQLVFQNRLTDTALLGEMQAELAEASQLNRDMQALCKIWKRRHERGCKDRTPAQRRKWAAKYVGKDRYESSIVVDMTNAGFIEADERGGV